jgi:tetratricopeptide (TPR) repeat protein
MTRISSILLVCLLFPFVGCETVEVIGGKEYPVSEEPEPDRQEESLLEALEENPDDVRAWYALAKHYETGLRLSESYAAYERFQAQVDRLEKAQDLKGAQRSTLGHWHMSKLSLRLGDVNRAANHCLQVLDRQPEKLAQAKANPHFQDTHFILAQLFFREGDDKKAHLHVMIHKELGGTRGDGILIGLTERRDAKAKPEKKTSEQGKG